MIVSICQSKQVHYRFIVKTCVAAKATSESSPGGPYSSQSTNSSGGTCCGSAQGLDADSLDSCSLLEFPFHGVLGFCLVAQISIPEVRKILSAVGVKIFTINASLTGWGVFPDTILLLRTWLPEESNLSFNILKFKVT